MSKTVKVVVYYGKARYDLSDMCCFCLWFINEGDYYVKSVNGKIAHYSCSKEGGWRKKPKPKKILPRPVENSVEKVTRPIRVVKRKK